MGPPSMALAEPGSIGALTATEQYGVGGVLNGAHDCSTDAVSSVSPGA